MSLAPPPPAFQHLITSHERLRQILPPPGGISVAKVMNHIDEHIRRFIETSPYAIIATADRNGVCDASPRGGTPGFVRIVDERRLFIAEATGNRRADSLENIIENPHVGMLFLIPGYEETLRLNGRACISTDPEMLAGLEPVNGSPPLLGIGIEIEECFLHCAKAAMRSSIWNPIGWPDLDAFPTAAEIFKDHTGSNIGDGSVRSIQALLEESYTKRL